MNLQADRSCADRQAVVCLASCSPRRRELLTQIGVDFVVTAVDIDERRLPDETPENYVSRLALAKARGGVAAGHNLPVLGADTAVVLDGRILGKPADRADGEHMLALLSGRSHQVLTGVALASADESVRVSSSNVTFRTLRDEERAAYWDSGEPADKAGGYAVQGLAAVFISRIEGSYSGVMGLPLFETAELLQQAGIPVIESRIITDSHERRDPD